MPSSSLPERFTKNLLVGARSAERPFLVNVADDAAQAATFVEKILKLGKQESF
jgi:hypothetical protein